MFNKTLFRKILSKARKLKGLEPDEATFLLEVQDEEDKEEIFRLAKEIKLGIYGKRIVFFAPLYLTNQCINDCLYCGFRKGNKDLKRKTLNQEELQKEVVILTNEGHKRLLVVAGEDISHLPVKKMVEYIDLIYENKDIRRINVNAAPMSVDDFKILKEAGIGTYQLFQETYHKETYQKMHPSGPKKDYQWRVGAMDRAMEAGIEDVGVGVLFGLYEPQYEIHSLLTHCKNLEKNWGIGPHTISVPRLKSAQGTLLTSSPYKIDDEAFKLIVSVLRIAVPYTGIILSTRESSILRDELLHLGVSQISAGSHTNPGGYGKKEQEGQFNISDERNLEEMVASVISSGYIPSFCTACYRKSRQGKVFMDLAKTGLVKGKCFSNALITFSEYLKDFASSEVETLGQSLIDLELQNTSQSERREIERKLKEICQGARDLPV